MPLQGRVCRQPVQGAVQGGGTATPGSGLGRQDGGQGGPPPHAPHRLGHRCVAGAQLRAAGRRPDQLQVHFPATPRIPADH
jgi:hypothetical protein